MNVLDILLDYLEENIDLEHVEKVEKLHLDSISYRRVPYVPLTVICPLDDRFKPFPYSDAYENPEKMLFNELLWSFSSIYNSVKIKDHFPYQIRSNHGVGIVASLLGAKCTIVNNNMPWVEHMDSLKEIKKIILKGCITDFNKGLGVRVVKTYKYYRDKLKEYPKCARAISITQPDLQGPFDTAHLIMGTDVFYQVYDNPDILHELLELITLTYIDFRKYIDTLLTDNKGENIMCIHGCIYGGKVLLKDDTALINLSQEMYKEFSKYYNDMILKAFSGGSIHYCGSEKGWHFDVLNSRYLKGINYGNPEMHNFKESYSYWRKYKIPILWWGYNQKHYFLDEVYNSVTKTGISLAALAESYEEGRRIMENHLEKSNS